MGILNITGFEYKQVLRPNIDGIECITNNILEYLEINGIECIVDDNLKIYSIITDIDRLSDRKYKFTLMPLNNIEIWKGKSLIDHHTISLYRKGTHELLSTICIRKRKIIGTFNDSMIDGSLLYPPEYRFGDGWNIEKNSILASNISNCYVVVVCGLWKKYKELSVYVKILWNLMLCFILTKWQWKYLIGFQETELLKRLALEIQGFTDIGTGIIDETGAILNPVAMTRETCLELIKTPIII